MLREGVNSIESIARYIKYCEDNQVSPMDHKMACEWLYRGVPTSVFEQRAFDIEAETRMHHLTNAQAIVTVWKHNMDSVDKQKEVV